MFEPNWNPLGGLHIRDPTDLSGYLQTLTFDTYTVTTFEYVEGGPDREAPEVFMKYQFVYLNLNVDTIWLNELDSVC